MSAKPQPLQATQLHLFTLPPDDGETQITGVVKKNDDGNYVAEIAGGWWVGHGATPDAAVKNAVEAYTKEVEAMTCR